MTLLITTRTIGSDCPPERAMRLCAWLREHGWPVEYGGTGPTPAHPLLMDAAFCAAFYAADEATWLERRYQRKEAARD